MTILRGVILIPSVIGHIPGFSSTIVPPELTSSFKPEANLGLVLFLFLFDLETNPVTC
ncbi:hypothetical protein F5X68DRAFT_234967 [Plectosphaerella plurivora]|uniref:Uncharacterized protein n=1 Tax=Plectosphaerella plurivora TaxID=936078 RepID=A0A9P8V6L2_9PEZI|nr:hypothetical protein F5X68DRAFT_234967 [Plectosphaerella plurivora]